MMRANRARHRTTFFPAGSPVRLTIAPMTRNVAAAVLATAGLLLLAWAAVDFVGYTGFSFSLLLK